MIEYFVPAICVVIGFLLGLLKDLMQKNIDFRDRRLNDTYQKRVVIYEEILNKLSSIVFNDCFSVEDSVPEITSKIKECVHELNTFIFRLSLLGSDNIVSVLNSITGGFIKEVEKMTESVFEKNDDASPRDSFFNTARKALFVFTEAAREETGAAELDKRIWKITKVNTKKKKVVQ